MSGAVDVMVGDVWEYAENSTLSGCRVTARLELREARCQYAARPFVPDTSDEELFGRPVKP